MLRDKLCQPNVVGHFAAICNGLGSTVKSTSPKHDQLRLQADITDEEIRKALMGQLMRTLQSEGIALHHRFSGLVKAVRCLPGVWQQGLHFDWQVGSAFGLSGEDVPLTVLWAVLDDFTLNLVPRNTAEVWCDAAAVQHKVWRDHAIVFRSDVLHGGGACLTSSWRLFARLTSTRVRSRAGSGVHMVTHSFPPTEEEVELAHAPTILPWSGRWCSSM